MLQRQQAQGLPIYSLQQQGVPNSGSAMRQLALSTAATADLLAGMAANTSHAHPGSASDLILAASATLQAFARAAGSAQNPVGVQQGVGSSGLVLSNSAGVGHLPEQNRQQLPVMQQQWQMPPPQTWNGNTQLF